MSQPTPIVMFGACGRMGKMILGCALEAPEKYSIVGAVDADGHPEMGKSLNELIPGGPSELRVTGQAPAEVPQGTVGIHFSLPEGTAKHLDWHRQTGMGAVIGTTGFDDEQLAAIDALGAHAPVLLTPNTSTGVNVLFWLAEKAAALLGEEYDMEITEMHHRHKKDAPSGTARGLAEAVMRARGLDYKTDTKHGREGIVGERPSLELGMHALRGGDVVGDHTLYLAGPGERLELTHRAHTRATFAQGALRSADWLSGKPAGQYIMRDVLGLTD